MRHFFLIILSIALISNIITPVRGENAKAKINSREFKILLKPEIFKSRKNGQNIILKIALNTAKETGAKLNLKPKKNRFKTKLRKIVFYDTKDFKIKKNGYALRIRTKYKRRILKDSYELTYKFRSTNPKIAIKGVIDPSSIFPSKSKFEQDITIKHNANSKTPKIKYIYSKSTKINNLQGDLTTINDFSKIFKGLKSLNLPGNTKLIPVNNIKFLERKIKPGYLNFGQEFIADFEITVWYKNYSKEPTICEVSFDYDIDNFIKNENSKASKLSEKFYLLLYKKLNEKGYIHKGSTKTNFTYGNAAK